MILLCDNIIAIEIDNNSVQHDQNKYIELDKNYIKDNLNSDITEVSYIKRAHQVADMRTRIVSGGPFHTFLSKLNMCDVYIPI